VSFYTTELPQYALIEAVPGPGPRRKLPWARLRWRHYL